MLDTNAALCPDGFPLDEIVRDLQQVTGGVAVAPQDFLARVERIVGGGVTPEHLAERYELVIQLQSEVRALSGSLYTPRF